MRIESGLVVAVSVALAAGCYNLNASSQGDSNATAQSQTAVATTPNAVATTFRQRLWAGFDDWTKADEPFPMRTAWSLSDDLGVTWNRLNLPAAIHPEVCAQTEMESECITGIDGDVAMAQAHGWLHLLTVATGVSIDGEDPGRYYILQTLLVNSPTGFGDYFWTQNATEPARWQFVGASKQLDVHVNHPSLDIRSSATTCIQDDCKGFAVAAWSRDDDGPGPTSDAIDIVYKTDLAAPWDNTGNVLATKTFAEGQRHLRPIVRVANSNPVAGVGRAYLAYMLAPLDHESETRRVRIERMKRSPDVGVPWTFENIFDMEIQIKLDWAGASPKIFRDPAPLAFDIALEGNQVHLYVGFPHRTEPPNPQSMFFFHCQESVTGAGTCGTTTAFTRNYEGTVFGSVTPEFLQPGIEAGDNGSVRLSWYNFQAAGSEGTNVIRPQGVRGSAYGTENAAFTGLASGPFVLSSGLGQPSDFEYQACPVGTDYGEYFGTALIPGGLGAQGTAVSAWTDSRRGENTCNASGQYDHHVQATIW